MGPICKLTDGSDKLLFRNADLEPAVYATLAEGFEAAKGDLYNRTGGKYDKKSAAAIVANASRNASPAAKRKNPKLKKVK